MLKKLSHRRRRARDDRHRGYSRRARHGAKPLRSRCVSRQGYNRGDNYNKGRTYRGYDQNYRSYRARQKCKDGDGGTIVGAIAGGLLGNTVAGRGDKTLGTILGGLGGALAGRAIDRSDRPNYCR